jgi:hypothetical protein
MLMNINKFYLLLAGAAQVLSFAACSSVYYSPNTTHLPTIRDKGEATIEGGVIGSSRVRGLEARAAYSPIKNWMVVANAMRLQGSSLRQESDPLTGMPINISQKGNGLLVEGGLGYYKPLSDFTTFSLVGGYGYGESNNFIGIKYANLQFTRGYVQPSISVTGKVADLGCGLRFAYLDFLDGDVDATLPDEELMRIRRIDDRDRFLMTDLGVQAGFNVSPIRIKCQMTFSLFENNNAYGFSSNTAGVSMALDLHKLSKKKKKK